MEEGLKIKIGADTVEVKKSLSDLQSQLKRFQSALTSSTDPKTVERLNKAILRTSQYIKGVKTAGLSSGLDKISSSSNSAGFALQNLGRVASDAPFGFVAIQNNLDPLFQSFGQLRKETGSTQGALKALGSSLLGGGGLGLAFTAVTAAITYFSLQSHKAKESTEKLKDTIRDISEVRAEAVGEAEAEINKVQVLVNVIKDETRSRTERNNALIQLKDINKEYFGDLTLEGNKLSLLTGKVEEYTKALIASSVVKGFEQEIAKVAPELRKQEAALEKVAEKYAKLEGAAKSAALAGTPNVSNFSGDIGTIKRGGFASDLKDIESQYEQQVKTVSDLRVQYSLLKTSIKEAVQTSIAFDPLSSGPKTTKSKVDALKGQIEALEKLKDTVGLMKSEELKLLDLKVQLEIRDQNENRLTGDQLKRVIDQLVVDADLEANPLQVPIKFAPKVGNTGEGGIAGGAFDAVTQQLVKSGQAAGEAVNSAIDLQKLQATADLVTSTLTPAFTGLFDSLISGSQTALQAVGQFLKDIIKRLAQAAIQAAIFAGIMSAFGLGGGASFGSLFKGQLLGGLGGGMQVNTTRGGGVRGAAYTALNVNVTGEVQGQALKLVMDRTTRSNNRLG